MSTVEHFEYKDETSSIKTIRFLENEYNIDKNLFFMVSLWTEHNEFWKEDYYGKIISKLNGKITIFDSNYDFPENFIVKDYGSGYKLGKHLNFVNCGARVFNKLSKCYSIQILDDLNNVKQLKKPVFHIHDLSINDTKIYYHKILLPYNKNIISCYSPVYH